MENETPTKEFTEQQMAILRGAMAVPAIAASMVNVSLTTMGFRLTFAERIGPGEEPQFRVAVMIPVEIALSMGGLIDQLLEKNPERRPPDGD